MLTITKDGIVKRKGFTVYLLQYVKYPKLKPYQVNYIK